MRAGTKRPTDRHRHTARGSPGSSQKCSAAQRAGCNLQFEAALSALCLCSCLSRVDPIPYDTPKPAGHTRFVCVSDTHSRTDGIQMPYGDVLLHMGDFTELGLPSEVKKFNDWLGTEQPRWHLYTHTHTHTHTEEGNMVEAPADGGPHKGPTGDPSSSCPQVSV